MNRATLHRRWIGAALDRVQHALLRRQSAELDALHAAIGTSEARWARGANLLNPREAEFRVFSQFGEDGIIQYLVGKVPITRTAFAEIGVGSYRESNTRFLLIHDNWEGVIFDAGEDHVQFVQESEVGWRHSIQAVSAWVSRANINKELARWGVSGDIGLLSVDVDGNDYWLLDALEVAEPRIIVVEYNSLFGPVSAVSVPYDPHFDRFSAHPSSLYFGASIRALHLLMSSRGYRLVAGNSVGSNLFFVREDVAGDLPSLSPAEAYVRSRFQQSRDVWSKPHAGDSHADALRRMRGLPLVDVEGGDIVRVGDLLKQSRTAPPA